MLLRAREIPLPPVQAPGDDVAQTPRVAVLFSGAVDCTVLARLAHDIIPSSQAIDLLNVAFENPRAIQAAKVASRAQNGAHGKVGSSPANSSVGSGDHTEMPLPDVETLYSGHANTAVFEICPDRKTGRKSLQELRRVCPQRIWNFVEESCLEDCSRP